MTAPVAVRNVPRWTLWLGNVDPMTLERWGKFVWLPLLWLAVRAACLRPVRTGVVVASAYVAASLTWWAGVLFLVGCLGWDRASRARSSAASGRSIGAYRRGQVRGKLRQNWNRYLRASQAVDGQHVVPKHTLWIRKTDTGMRVKVKHGPAGITISDLRDAAPTMTGLIGGIHSVRIRPVNPDYCEMYVNLINPLGGIMPIGGFPVSPFPRVTLGRASEGYDYSPTLLGKHILVVGQTGAGKSSLVWNIVRGAEQWDTPPQWWVLDPKMGIEMAAMDPERGGIATYYERDPRMADKMFQLLFSEAERRGEIMRANDWKTWTPARAEKLGPLVFGLVDELLSLGKKATGEQSYLRKLLQLSRATGVQVIANSQLPQSGGDALGRIAQMFNARFVGATQGPGMTSSALGDYAVSEAPAHLLSLPGDAGIFYAVEEGRSGYVKFKAGFQDDEKGEHLPAARGELRKTGARVGRLLANGLSVTDALEQRVTEDVR